MGRIFRSAAFVASRLAAWWFLQSLPSVPAKREDHHFGKTLADVDNLQWVGTYEDQCSVSCGSGFKALKGEVCINFMRVKLPKHRCEVAAVPRPAPAVACEEVIGCQWQLAAAPRDRCGWSDVTCAAGGSPEESLQPYCEKAAQAGIIMKRELFQSKYGLINDGCPTESLESICTITVNQPSASGVLDSPKTNLEISKAKVEEAIRQCNSPDIIAIDSQEMYNLYADNFSPFSDHFAAGEYAEAGRCEAKISPGVQVLVKEAKRKYFAPLPLSCFKDDGLYGGAAAVSNTKGTAFLQLNTVKGILVAASTHAQHGGVISEARVQQVLAAARQITDMKPKIVAWAGDFNHRTDIEATTSLGKKMLALGSSHPEEFPTKDGSVYEDPSPGQSQDPVAALRELQQIPDPLGGEDGKTLQELLTEETQGLLSEVPGIRRLCPTYRKAPNAGQFKDSGMLLLSDGSKVQKKMFGNPADAKKLKEWMPYFGCKAEGYPLEYFLSPLDKSKTPWPKRAPSWTERIVVTTSAAGSCDQPEKVISEEDHDVLLARCRIH